MVDLIAALPSPGGVATRGLAAIDQRGGKATDPKPFHLWDIGEVVPVEHRVGIVVDHIPGIGLKLCAKELVAVVVCARAVEARWFSSQR